MAAYRTRIAAGAALVVFWTLFLIAVGAGAAALVVPAGAALIALALVVNHHFDSVRVERPGWHRERLRVARATGLRAGRTALQGVAAWLRTVGRGTMRMLSRGKTAAAAALRDASAMATSGARAASATATCGARAAYARGRQQIGVVAGGLGTVRERAVATGRAVASAQASRRAAAYQDARRREAWSLNYAASEYRRQGRPEQAIGCCERALAIVRELGDRRAEALTLNTLGLALTRVGDDARASDSLERAAQIFRELDDAHAEGQVLANLGMLQERQDRAERALEYWQEALERLEAGSPEHELLAERVRAAA